MKPFVLERYLAQHEFTAPYVLCASDCEAMSIKELLEITQTDTNKFLDVWLGYTEALGHPELRQAISKLYEKISPNHVLAHAGAEEAIFNFAQTAFNAQDHLIVHWPCYQSLHTAAEMRGCRVTKWEANEKTGWSLDLEFLKRSITSLTKAVIVNFPHNPTGYIPTKDWFMELVSVCRQKNILLFVDEVYRQLEYETENTLPAACDLYENAVSLGVMSKSYGLAGLRVGWIATRNKDLFEKMCQFKDYTSICNSAPSEFLATVALKNKDLLWKRNRDLIASNLNLLDSFMASHPDKFAWQRPKAGCLAFPRYLRSEGAEAFCNNLLEAKGTLLAPGKCFEFGDHHFRIGFGRKNFPQALGNLEQFLKESR